MARVRPLPRSLARAVCATLLLGAGLAASSNARADEPVPPSYHDPDAYPPPSAQVGLALVGFGASAVWYGAGVGVSYLWPDAPGAADLRTPVIGPWLALGETGCADDDPDCSTFIVVLRAILTTMDGVGQAGGLAVMGEALFLPTVEPQPGTRPRPRQRLRRSAALELTPVPMMTEKGGFGLGVVGSF